MADDKPQYQSEREERIVTETLRDFATMTTWRNVFALQWEEISRLIWPEQSNTFMYGSFNFPGMKRTQYQVDATGQSALHKFAAICDSLLTPRNSMWHQLEASNPYLMKNRDVRLWFEDTTRRLFKYRYSPTANFAAQNYYNFRSLGAFGTAGMFVDELDDPYHGQRGLRYKGISLGELFLRENHQGLIDGFIRWFRLTARQAYQKWGDKIDDKLKAALEQGSEDKFDFLHHVCPRDDYEKGHIGARGKPFLSCYISVQGRRLLDEGGYRMLPIACSRYDQAPQEVYGRSPAMMVLPALKTLNAEKTTFLKQGHRASDPVLLTTDDGVVGMSLRPGAINKGGMSIDGKPLIGVLPTGNIQINEKMMDMEVRLIEDAFLTNLFQLALNLKDLPQMTATQVIEIMNQKGILLAPTIGRQQSEYLGPMIDRELDVLASQKLLAPMPPLLREAKGEYEVLYTSELSRAQRMSDVSGFFRSVEFSKEIVNVTQDLSALDWANFDRAMPEVASIQGSPERWTSTDREIAAKRQSRAQQQQAEQQIKALPNIAAMKKADAAQYKAGMMQPPQNTPMPTDQGLPQ